MAYRKRCCRFDGVKGKRFTERAEDSGVCIFGVSVCSTFKPPKGTALDHNPLGKGSCQEAAEDRGPAPWPNAGARPCCAACSGHLYCAIQPAGTWPRSPPAGGWRAKWACGDAPRSGRQKKKNPVNFWKRFETLRQNMKIRGLDYTCTADRTPVLNIPTASAKDAFIS